MSEIQPPTVTRAGAFAALRRLCGERGAKFTTAAGEQRDGKGNFKGHGKGGGRSFAAVVQDAKEEMGEAAQHCPH